MEAYICIMAKNSEFFSQADIQVLDTSQSACTGTVPRFVTRLLCKPKRRLLGSSGNEEHQFRRAWERLFKREPMGYHV